MKAVIIVIGVFFINSCAQNYCREDFLNFLVLKGITIEIIKCSEGNFVTPSTLLVVRVSGDSEYIKNFLQFNGFTNTDSSMFLDEKTESWKREDFAKQYKPFSQVLRKGLPKYIYTNDSIGVSMIYTNNLLFVNHQATWFQN